MKWSLLESDANSSFWYNAFMRMLEVGEARYKQEQPPWREDRCQYHEHDEGERCKTWPFRSAMKKRKQ